MNFHSNAGNIRFESEEANFSTPKKTDPASTKLPLEEPKKPRKYTKRQKPKEGASTLNSCRRVRGNSRFQAHVNPPGYMSRCENGYGPLRYGAPPHLHRPDIYQGQRISTSQLKMQQNYFMNFHYNTSASQSMPASPQLYYSQFDTILPTNARIVVPEFGCVFEETEDYKIELERLLSFKLNEAVEDEIMDTTSFWRNDELDKMLFFYELDSSSELNIGTRPLKEIIENFSALCKL